MKIAVISKLHLAVSSSASGGIEVFNHNLSNELSTRDHEIFLFATGNSETSAKLHPICERGLFEDPENIDPQAMRKIIYRENKAFIDAIEFIKQNNFDIIHHSHSEFLPVYLGSRANIPQVFTCHITDNTNTTLYKDFETTLKNNDVSMVSISLAQQKKLNQFNFIGNVYNGISLEAFTFNENPSDYLVSLGRISPNKGVKEAIEIADKANQKLRIAGGFGVGEVADRYKAEIEELLASKQSCEYLGEVGKQERDTLLSNARALLFPLQWDEPFGLVVAEAMACGTPVITYNRGSMSELVEDGVTGFVVEYNDEKSMIEAINKIDQIDRRKCRQRVEELFSDKRMVDEYLKIYEKVINSDS